MRTTKTVAVWPVGLVGKLMYESPLCENGKVIGRLKGIAHNIKNQP